MGELRLDRRQFIRSAFMAAGLTLASGIASACGPLLSLTIDSQYFSLGRRQRALGLIAGRIPESWKTLSQDALIPVLEREIADALLPEICAILGGDAQMIASRLEYDDDENKLFTLVQSYGESNSDLAAQVAKQTVGVTVSRYNEKETVTDKRIAINLNKIRELGEAKLAKTNAADETETKARMNTFVVQSVADAVMHEATHYIMEIDRLPQAGDLERMQAMYSGGAIGTVEFERLLYYEGAQVAFISRGGYKYYLNKALTEIIRAYVMQRFIDNLEAGTVGPPFRFRDSVYLVDTATIEVMNYLHDQMGILRPAPPLDVFKHDLLRIIDYYQDPVTVASQSAAKKVTLADRDFVRIFGLMESLYVSVSSAIAQSGGREIMPAEMTYRAKLEIEKVVAQAKERA